MLQQSKSILGVFASNGAGIDILTVYRQIETVRSLCLICVQLFVDFYLMDVHQALMFFIPGVTEE